MAKLGKNLKKSHKHSSEEKMMTLYYKSITYYEKNKNIVLVIAGIIIALLIVLFLYSRNQNQKSEEASLELSKVSQLYTNDMFNEAINGDSLGYSKGLTYIVNNYGSTESGEVAKIMLANSYYNLGDYNNAEKYYKDYSGKSDLLKAASLAGLASIFEINKNYKEAANYYEKAANIDKNLVTNDEYLFYAIKNYYNANDTNNLKNAVKVLKADYPKSKYISMIIRYDSDI